MKFLTFSGFVYLFILLLLKLFTEFAIGGWSLVIAMQLILIGFLMLVMGIFGEYIGRIYDEARNRPLYIVRECYGLKNKERKLKRCLI